MCFYTTQTKNAIEVENRFNAKFKNISIFSTSEIYNGFTFPQTPVITNNNPLIIDFYYWGLIPFWAKTDEIRKNTLNAKIETLSEKPSFRICMNNRCLIIVDGFFEWQWLDNKGKQKQKYKITMPDYSLFAFGGLWSEWVNKETGEIIKSYTIVTTEANQLMSEIHNTKKRMPLILNLDNEKEWLNGKPKEHFIKPNVQLIAEKAY